MAVSKAAPAWRRVFLRELARSGSVALAAEKAGIDRSGAYQARRRNAAFAASWARAVETARGSLEERERDVRLAPDEVVRPSRAGRPCIARAGPGRWSAKAERAFLEELAASANVSAAARAAGVSPQAAYRRRRQRPAFAAAWDEAKAEGWARLEMLLIRAATATLDPEPEARDARDAPPMTVDQALNLYKLHRASQQGGRPQRYGWRRQDPDIEEVRAEILRKVAALERARDKAPRKGRQAPGAAPPTPAEGQGTNRTR